MSSTTSTRCSTGERVASRRTVVRGAAWSTAAVTIVVATPNVAAASTPKAGTLTALTSGPVKYNDRRSPSTKHVKWDLVLTNTGTVDLTGINIVCTFLEQAPAEITDFTVEPGAWTASKPPTFTATYAGTVPVGGTLSFTPDFKGANNSSGTLIVALYDGTQQLATLSGSWHPA